MSILLATTILIIGDSHTVGPFGQTLDQLFRDSGAQVATYASCGSVAGWWYNSQKTNCGYFQRDLSGKKTEAKSAPTPVFTDLLTEIRPDQVIVALGTNYVRNTNDNSVIADLTAMKNDILRMNAECFWVLPPDMRQFRSEIPRLKNLMQKAMGEVCRYFESDKFTSYPTSGGDGIHYWSSTGTPIAKSWAQEVHRWYLSI